MLNKVNEPKVTHGAWDSQAHRTGTDEQYDPFANSSSVTSGYSHGRWLIKNCLLVI